MQIKKWSFTLGNFFSGNNEIYQPDNADALAELDGVALLAEAKPLPPAGVLFVVFWVNFLLDDGWANSSSLKKVTTIKCVWVL